MKVVKYIVLSLMFSAAICATLAEVMAQCSGGSCTRSNCSSGYCPLPQHEDSQWHAVPDSATTSLGSGVTLYDFDKAAALPRYNIPEANTPTPAWRYEQCRGKYKSVVRVMTHDGGNVRSRGSGCVIRWGKRVVVVTAAHVVRDAKAVFVRGVKAWHRCRMLRHNCVWDVAVLEPDSATDFHATNIAWRETGTLKPGDRVESCGFGGDERLAVNSGRVLKFNRPTGSNAPDWICLSGHARQGDSGGPVLNERGELVGVLWGTDGETVFATQCGRLHEIINLAAGPYTLERKYSYIARERPIVPVVPASQQTGLLGEGRGILPLCPPRRPQTPAQAPQPNVVVQADPRVGNALQSIDTKLDTVVANTTPTAEDEAKDDKGSPPVLAILAVVAGIVVGVIVYFAAQKDT